MSSNPDADATAATWLGFGLGSRRYAVPLLDVQEVIHGDEPVPVPGAPDDVLGIVSLRGNIVTVIDGGRRLAVSAAAGPSQPRLMIFHGQRAAVGMPIDALHDTLELAPDEQLAGTGSGDDPVLGILKREDGDITLLDVRTLCRPRPSAMETAP